jgi:predicted membrane protein
MRGKKTSALFALAVALAILAPAPAARARQDGAGDGAERQHGDGDGVVVVDQITPPLAGWGILMWLDFDGGGEEGADSVAVAFGSGDETVFVPFSIAIGDKLYFVGNPVNEYSLARNPVGFGDIEGHWAHDVIIFNAVREVYRGFEDGSFRPNAMMTRGMFASILARMALADLSGYADGIFDDVDPEAWYGPAVVWAFRNGIVEGIGGGMFNPDGNITRQDMALVITRFMAAVDIELAGGDPGEPFADEDTIGFWAADAVELMRQYGIVQGRPHNMFDPRGFSTRAEIASVIFRLIESTITDAHMELHGEPDREPDGVDNGEPDGESNGEPD